MTPSFPTLCPSGPLNTGDGYAIDGVEPGQHMWADGPSWEGPGPVGEAPVLWEELVCENCGAVTSGWRPLVAPTSDGSAER